MERKKSFHARDAAPIIGWVLVALPSCKTALNETQVYGIAKFDGALQCSNGSSHSVHTTTAAAFAEPFLDRQADGLWDTTHTRNNTSARGSYWTDATKAARCECTAQDMNTNAGVDEADVVYVHTHGGHSVSPAFSNLSMGRSSYDCEVRTDDNMLFGNPAGSGDLEIAVIKACQSGDYETWANGGYFQFVTSDSRFSIWNAFHGDSSCGSHVTSYVGDYAASSFSNGVGENWIDEAYAGAFWWWEDDDCPVSIVTGSTWDNRELMYEYGGFRDRKNTGTKNGSTIYYIVGCNPDNGSALPD